MSLAVKYRPASLNDMIGQEDAVRIISGAVRKKQARVFLLSGTRGSGKTSLARLIAKEYGIDASRDVVELDGASNNGVNSIKSDILPYMETYPMASDYKLVIVDECHMLSKAAWAALLKPSEELPGYLVIVFCTTDIQKVPDAIASRAISISLRNLSNKSVKDRLSYICKEEKISITEEALDILALESDGSMREAISNLEGLSLYTEATISSTDAWKVLGGISYTMIHDFIRALMSNNNKVVSEILKTTHDKLFFFNRVLKYLTDTIVKVYTSETSEWLKEDLSFLQFLLKKMVNIQIKLSGSDIDLSVMISAFFLALLNWADAKKKDVFTEKNVSIKDILDTLGFFRVW